MVSNDRIIRSTTVLGLIRDGKAVLGADGQVTVGQTVMKHHSRKIRKMYRDTVLAGFAGSAADAFTLSEKFEAKLEEFRGNFERAAVELAKDWRTDKYLRRLEALLAVVNAEKALIISGTGDVIEPDDGIVAIGSGGSYALAAARMLMQHTDMPAKTIVEESLRTAADICIYTNSNIVIEELS
ncbi:MAG: HslU--HslV peptidase proteolytic subunit [Ignavibacteria bacterium]|nr:MAG: HslU--HslV peptidase proteolytic subunit [Ignavibacteria bacterium]